VDLNEFSESSFTADVTATDRPESPSALIPIKLIIGERLLQRRELLSEMQDKQRIELIERTLGFNEDIIIDDKTCVLIRKLSTLPNLVMQPTTVAVDLGSKEKEQRKLLIELIKLALKYPSVWLLIEVDDDILQYVTFPFLVMLQTNGRFQAAVPSRTSRDSIVDSLFLQ
jgi:hypothetical protein